MRISYILLNDRLVNLYINSGHYPYKVAEEMKSTMSAKVEVKEAIVNITEEELLEFINKNQKSMNDKIVRSQEDINIVLDKAMEGIEEGSVYPGMSYEEGIQAMYDWLVGNTDDTPFE